MLALAFVAMFASGPGQSYLVAVFVDDMLGDAHLSRLALSALYAAATVASAIVAPRIGRAFDRFGGRAVWILAAVGLAAACELASLVHGLALAFVALACLRTFGQGAFMLLGTLLVNRGFRRRRGHAMAIASMGLPAAATALPSVAVALILAVGWRDAYRLLGLAVLCIVLPLALLVRTGPARTAEAGAAPRRGPRALRRSRRLRGVEVPTARTWRLLFVFTGAPLLVTSAVFHAVSLLGQRGLSLTETGAVLGALGVASAVGNVAAGVVADRVSSRALLVGIAASLAAGMALLLVPSAAAAWIAFVLLGLGAGAYPVATGVVWPRTYGVAEIGRLQGIVFAAQIAAAAAGPLPLAISGALTRDYRPAIGALAAFGGIAFLAALRWRDPRALRFA